LVSTEEAPRIVGDALQNSEGAATMRGRPFQKGVSGNPDGRPLLATSVAGYVRLKGGEDARIYIDQLHVIATSPRENARTRLVALALLLDRGYGKAPQMLEVPTVFDLSQLASLTDEELGRAISNLDTLIGALQVATRTSDTSRSVSCGLLDVSDLPPGLPRP
jgi:hypothetical protein